LVFVLFLGALSLIKLPTSIALFLLHLHSSQLLIKRLKELALISLTVSTLRRVNELGVCHLHKVHENALQFTFVHILQIVSVVHDVVPAIALLVRHRCQGLTQLVEVGGLLLVVVVVLVVLISTAALLVLIFSAAAATLVGLTATPILIILVLATAVILSTLVGLVVIATLLVAAALLALELTALVILALATLAVALEVALLFKLQIIVIQGLWLLALLGGTAIGARVRLELLGLAARTILVLGLPSVGGLLLLRLLRLLGWHF